MKKSRLLAAALCSLCLVAGAVPASADGMRVVTLGADLTDAQKQTMMKYFRVNSDEVQVMYITNQDERNHLANYVPASVIGTRTVSCAYVKPTSSGGIKVRTANLTWVTGNMIATTLSTSGVKNCEVVAACPFEVSGTGALTGIQMAYETASGTKLDETKKQIATEEIVVTGNLADEIGKTNATNVVNKAKIEVIQNDVQNADEIYNIVNNIVQENNLIVNPEQMDKIVALLEEIAEQNYEYEDMQETLEHIDENVSGEVVDASELEEDEEELVEVPDEDSIMNDLDESVLGADVVESSTEDPTLEEETGMDDEGFETFTFEDDGEGEEFVDVPDDTVDMETDGGEAPVDVIDEDGNVVEIPDEEPSEDGMEEFPDDFEEPAVENAQTVTGTDKDSMIASLSEQTRSQYDKAVKFCEGEYQANDASLYEAMGDGFARAATVADPTAATKLSDAIEQLYLGILVNGTGSYVPNGTEKYMSTELNMINESLRKLFGIDGMTVDPGQEDILVNVDAQTRQLLYNDTIRFFERMYGEETFAEEPAYEEAAPVEETYEESYDGPEETYEDSYEDSYDEEYYDYEGDSDEEW